MPTAAAKKKAPPPAQWKGNPKLEPFLTEVKKLREDPKNARRHPPKNIQAVADSILDAGQQVALVVDKSGKIIKGNGTYRAVTQVLGWTKVAAIEFDGDARTARRFGVNDNRTGELAEWEFEELAGIAREEIELGGKLAGWDDHELEPLLKADWEAPEPGDGDAFDPGDRKRGQNRGHLFSEFTPEQQQVVLTALTKARKKHGDLTNEQAIVKVCEAYAGGR